MQCEWWWWWQLLLMSFWGVMLFSLEMWLDESRWLIGHLTELFCSTHKKAQALKTRNTITFFFPYYCDFQSWLHTWKWLCTEGGVFAWKKKVRTQTSSPNCPVFPNTLYSPKGRGYVTPAPLPPSSSRYRKPRLQTAGKESVVLPQCCRFWLKGQRGWNVSR